MKKPVAAAQPPPFSNALRIYLYLTAAVTGAAILIVEILGAKILSPYVGTSHFVWTAQIAVTLLSLATGYYLGGWLVDRSPRLGLLYSCIVVAAIYLSFTILASEPMAYWCLRFRLATGSILASLFLFFVPLTLLAMVCPFLVRILTRSVAGVGGQVGRLSAISTLGSVLGTMLIGYVLIPLLPNSVTMFVTAALLLVVALGYFAAWGRSANALTGSIAGGLLVLALGLAGLRQEQLRRYGDFVEVYRANSNFGLLQVLESRGGQRRMYLNDYLIQNTYDPAEKKSMSMFTYMLHQLARAYTAEIRDVLCIGLGIGIVPAQFTREGARVDVVEINPAVLPVAVQHFGFDPERVNVIFGDGRYYLNRATNRYDAVILDAFLGDSSPSHLMTRNAFQSMRRLLRPSGVLVINCFGNFEPGKDFFTASLHKTLQAVFSQVRIHDGGNGNVFFVASDQPQLTLRRTADLAEVHTAARAGVERAFNAIVQTNPDHGMVLRDDYNPVEVYDAPNRELIRRQLALSMRSR